MRWRFFKAAPFAVALHCVVVAPAALAENAMGVALAVEGRPTATGVNGTRPLSAGSDVFEGDTVSVGDGNAQLQLDDGTKIVVGPSSRLVLQAYLRRNATTASKIGIKALRGSFRFITGKSPKSAYNINTSNATIGIRGTGFDFRVDNRTLLAVLQGAVRLRGSNGQAVNSKSGCGVAEAGGSGFGARALSGKAKSDALQNELPFVTDQSNLLSTFHLPIKNCLIYLGINETPQPGMTPQQLLPLVPALAIPAAIVVAAEKNTPLSPERRTPPAPPISPLPCSPAINPNCVGP